MASGTYNAKHLRVKHKRGRARDHACADCGGQARHWATIHGRDGSSPEDYRPLCVSCHYRYDDHHGQRPGEANSYARLTEAQVLGLWSKRWSGGTTALARQYGIHVQTIYNIWYGRNWAWLTGAIGADPHVGEDSCSEG